MGDCRMNSPWPHPIILAAGALQAWGSPMNGAPRGALTNPWLASLVSYLPVVAFLTCLLLCQPRPLPTLDGTGGMPWWAPLAELPAPSRSWPGCVRGQGWGRSVRGPDDRGQHPDVAGDRSLRIVWNAAPFDEFRPRDRRPVDDRRHRSNNEILMDAHPDAEISSIQAETKAFRAVSLDALNFLLADVRGAPGPYLNVFLVTQLHGSQSSVGVVTTVCWV